MSFSRLSLQNGGSVVPFQLPGSIGPLLCVHWRPGAKPADDALLILPAFAEEMNKCRRMVALLAEAAQHRGVETLSVDLTGTGDSAGDFRDATLERWQADLRTVVAWMAERGPRTLHVCAVRAGALLVNHLELPSALLPGRVVLWQPIASGKQLVTQFLRLRQAEAVLSGGAEDARDPRAMLEQDGFVEVAGYDLTATLASSLEPLALHPMRHDRWGGVLWAEIVGPVQDGASSPQPTPAGARAVAALRAERGPAVALEAIVGEPFWATPEIAVVTPLIERTVEFVCTPS